MSAFRQGDGTVIPSSDLDGLYRRVRKFLTEARAQVWRAVNTAMVAAYWEIGRAIVDEEQGGEAR
jgi:DUF1016 N-terminal domain